MKYLEAMTILINNPNIDDKILEAITTVILANKCKLEEWEYLDWQHELTRTIKNLGNTFRSMKDNPDAYVSDS